jgi:hypothetical protein
MTFRVVIRDRETAAIYRFLVGIDANRAIRGQESDAVFAARSERGLWDRGRYPLHSICIVPNGVMEHDKVMEVSI